VRRTAVAVIATTLALAMVAAPDVARAQARPLWVASEPVPEPDYPRVTASAAWLAERLGARDVVVVDARDEAAYSAGHVPGAVSLPPSAVPDMEALTGAARLPGLLGSLGMSGREQLICCGDTSLSPEAARVFWLLEAAGATRVLVLEGGFEGWREAGLDVSSVHSALPEAIWTPQLIPDLVASREYVRRSFGEPGVEIVDARGTDAWAGHMDRSAWGTTVRAGHIPHALPLDLSTCLTPDGKLATPPETWTTFSSLGPRPANPVELADEFVVHGDGVSGRGALCYFLLRRAGIERLRLYPGGWKDWSDDPWLPVVRVVGAEELMWRLSKERRWFRPSAPPSAFAFFDVRHPADHERGHIRGAASLRSDYFADSLDVRLEQFWPELDRTTDPVVTYCYGEHCIRSRATSTAAARAGFVYVERFYGGLDEWRNAGGRLEE
jgi:thiosulfate/3-mercaptopyruvate sulfurtransferase